MVRTTYDIFITHAWRYHDDWTRVGSVLDGCAGFSWRNFSVPWYDPAMDPNTEIGARFIRRWLESQIIPVAVVVFLGSVYAVKSARKWLEMEVEMARRHGKPVLGLPSFGETELAAEARTLVDATSAWTGEAITAAIERMAPN
jgi:MTH538 TIR-like domain (DUF1863)